MITFVHAADVQVGKPFAGIADPAKRTRVQQERIECLRRIGDVVRRRRAAFVVLAGDVFDSPSPTTATVAATLGAIASLEVPVYCIPGNHDHGGPDSLWEDAFFRREHALLAANFHLLLEPAPVVIDVAGDDGGPASVVLLPCPLRRRHEADDPTAWIRGLDFAPYGDRPRIVIAHGSTTVFAPGVTTAGTLVGPGATSQADEEEPAATAVNTLALDRLPIAELDYLALGDWHGFLAAGPKAYYSGAPEIDRFPRPGQMPGHVAVVSAGRGVEPRVEAVRTGRFRWLVHSLALGDDGAGPLDDWLGEATRPAAAGEPGFDACLARLEVTGTLSLAQRAEFERIVESWTARLLRLDLDDRTILAPSADEIRELAERPGDPIIARVAAELVGLLERAGAAAASAGGTGPRPAGDAGDDAIDPDVIRRAIHVLHALATAGEPEPADEPAGAEAVPATPAAPGRTGP